MNSHMKLSVVIPTYNRRDSLRRTLDGLARQTYPMSQFEAVVVSDGGTDGTEEMLAAYEAAFPLRAVTQPNSGPSTARNRGVREASHEVIVFLDDDVEPVPEFLARHAAHHTRDEKVVVLGPMSPDPANAAREPVWIAWEHAKLQQIYDLFRPGGTHVHEAPKPLHFYSGNASVRRTWLEAVGGFDETFHRQEDVELAVRLERECDVRFVWDFAADGLHRPVRTFESWLRIPSAYGSLDAQRVAAGGLDRDQVEENLRKRSTGTRLLSGLCVGLPAAMGPVTVLSRAMLGPLERQGRRGAALCLLSALYNSCYAHAYFTHLPRTAHGSAAGPGRHRQKTVIRGTHL
jgi:hypothetical protein